jgi:hypothetical protein
MLKKYILLSLLSFSLLVGCAYPNSFNFTAKEPQWTFYGDGSASYVTDMGRNKDHTSMWLSTDWGENQTAYYTWKDLSPGLYKVITFVRAKDVQKGAEGISFWHFYDGGFGTQSPFMDLYGNYNWRKVEYTIRVKEKSLTAWFRLKAPGQVWVDEFFLEKIDGAEQKVAIDPPAPLPLESDKSLALLPKAASKKKLYTFDSSEPGHPFKLKNKAGEFSPHEFLNFKIKNMPIKDWSAFDRLEMDVFNPNGSYTNFYVTLGDDKTKDYWSQTNYKQTLAPGWNHLSFDLYQYLGERGSHRFNRSINLSKLEKFFISIDPESKINFEKNSFLIDNIYLSANPLPELPKGVMAFDFTSSKSPTVGNMTRVTTQSGYTDERGYGFINPQFWRVEDSEYASSALRYSIGILKGHFKVNLPNGKYQISLNIDKLGYWDVPFWSDRTVFANGSPIFKETRNAGKDFLNDLLMFEGVVPELKDHPYDLYLSKVFHPIEKIIDVTNGSLDLEFNGDATGVSLNSLLLWNKNQDAEGLAYKNAFEKRNKQEFDWMSRSLQKNEALSSQKNSVSIVEPDLTLNPSTIKKPSADHLSFSGGAGDNPYQLIQFTTNNSDEKATWSFSDFTNEKGEKINKESLLASDVVYQYTSPDTNHETYLITGKYLAPLSAHALTLKKKQSHYLWLQLSINEKMGHGIFKGEGNFQVGSESIKFPITIEVMNYTLPKIEFPVGFFGIDPLPYSYFTKPGYTDLRRKYRLMALDKIGNAGFTTFTGLPEDVSELDELFKASSKWGIETVYSYGGQFPQSRLDLTKKPEGMTEEAFYNKSSQELKSLFANKSWPKIVHTFSDEAGGYADKIFADIEVAKKLQKYFPFMPLGGFGFFQGQDSNKLNSYFDYGFYSSLTKSDISKLKNDNKRWGFYNASAGNLDDPRFSFGLGLYIARLNGLSQYLEWNSTAFNNYPYYDFDGRESDIVMFYPSKDGKLFNSLRFELSTEGIHVYKKLKLLEAAVENNVASPAVKTWLESLRRENYFYSSTTFLNDKKNNFREFKIKLDENLRSTFLRNK